MTLIENIKIALALADEYAPDSGYEQMYTDDEDFRAKMKLLYQLPYHELANIKKIRKVKNISRNVSDDAPKHYTPYSLPMDMAQLKNIIVLDSETNQPVDGDYFMIRNENKIYINDQDKSTYKIEYNAIPETITENTEDDFELEIDEDAQNALPYKVIADFMKTDPSVDQQLFETAYQNAIAKLDLRESETMITIRSEYDF